MWSIGGDVEHRWNDTDGRKPKKSQRKTGQGKN